jgi:hypothetical protein
MTQQYLSPRELSERWEGRIATKTLANWRSDPEAKGPRFRKIGRRVLYLLPAVVEWEQEHDFKSTREYGGKSAN